jgi:hypothetical protein
MSEASNAETEDSPYVRAPWPLVTAGLLGVLVLGLAIGLFANRNLRPNVANAPTSAVAVPPLVPTSLPPAAVATTPTVIQTSLPIAVPTAAQELASPTATVGVTSVPPTPTVPAPTPTPTPTVAATLRLSPTPSATPTVDPALAEEVGKAYETFWQVRSQALLELDTTHLNEVMEGDYLTNEQQLIDQLRADGRAIKTQVVLNYSVVQATDESASIVDSFKDNSVYVQIGTEEPLTAPPSDQLTVLYTLRNSSGTWKVIDSVRPE